VPFGVPTFSRRETAESRPPTPVARAAARRATAANARGGARAFDDGVRHRVECLEMALAHPRTPHAARIARARLRSGLGSGCTLRSRDVEDKMRPAPEGPTGSRRRAAVSSTPRSASPKRALHETLAHLDSTAHRSRFPFLLPRRAPRLQKKKWEKQALNQNGNPVRHPMHVKTNDKVVVITGADKGKVTEVVEVFTKSGTILCKDVNIKTKHVKPKGEGETGQIIQKEWPIHHSNVMHWSEAKQVRSRVGHKMVDGKKVRVLKKTDEVLAN
jgi:large subunit ribosomal protein L24